MESRRCSRTVWRWCAVALLGSGVAVSPAAFAQKRRSAGQTIGNPKIDPRLSARAQSQTPIRVLVVLTDQPQAGIFQQVEGANALAQQIAESQYQRVAAQPFASLAELSQAGAAVDAVVLQTRQQAFQAIEQAIGPEQDAMESRLAGWGATRISRYQGINMLAAEIPASAIALLEADPSVAEVFPVEVQYAQLATSVPALGAPAFWTAGYTGQGQSVGVLDTGARTNHPAFAGKSLVSNVFLATASTDPCFNDNASSGEDQNGHGTHVTGIVMSQGSAGWTNYQGVAKGVGTLYNLKIGFNVSTSGTCGGGGESYSSDVLSAIDWAVKNTPLKVLNYSFGGTASGDDDAFTRSIDQYADTYGLTIAIAAGNTGPGSHTVGSPGIAYNSITAANWVSRGTIAGSSSRGPTNGGRYKPDLAAPGSTIYSTNYRWDNSSGTGDDFVAMTGTSMASPHLAGSAAVVRSAGVSNALAVKAVLINTTDNAGWASDRGWGYTNLTRAQQELNYATGSLAGSGFQLYKITPSGAVSASVTWNRHISGSTSYFNNIDLYLFRADTGAQLASSTTTLQDVEEVSATYSGDAVVTVDMVTSSLAGVSSEPYGVAFSSPATSVSGPSLTPSCSLPSSIPAGSQFTLSCTATNRGDLTAFAVTGQVQLPSGFSGAAPMALGDVPAGQTSSAGNLNLTAPATAGTYSLPFTASSTSFDETFSGTASYTATVVATLPAPVLSAPANGATGVSQTPRLSWSASSGATSYDVYLGTTSSPPLATNTTVTSYSPATLSAGTLYYWRVVAKNTGGSNSSATWSFTTLTAAPPAPALPSPANGATGIATTPSLSWSASSGATSYDVYFGTASSPPLATNTATTGYSPGTLSAGTLYYWRVVAKNASGSNSSATWSFTTLVAGPPAPTLSSPANGATGVSATPSLIWSASSGATSYDVYFGTASSPPLATNTAGTTYSPGTLSAGTVYYWRVVAKNAGGSNGSVTWSFTTQVAAPPAPVLSAPANGATGVSATAVLSWTAASRATSYDVYFGTVSSPPLATNTAGTTYSPGTLNSGTVYYWYVVAKNAGGSNTSATWSFTTQVAAPPAPILSAPANGATGVSAAPVLGWGAASGATSYDVYFGTVASPPLATNTAGTTYSPGTLTAGTVYYWRVVAKNAGGSNTSATWSFTTQVAAPPAPILSFPANGATGVPATLVMSWSAASGATSYDVYFGTVSPPPLATNTAVAVYSPGTLSAGTVYYWYVVAKNAGGSNGSATWSFTTQVAAPPAPVLSSPANGATGVSATPVLGWSASSGATSYDVYFGTVGSPPLATNTGGTTYSPGTLTAGTVYYWRVVAKNAGGSNTSATWSFTTQVAAPPAPVPSSPANGATGVSAAPVLGWSASSGATSYDVYFGTVGSPPLATNTAVATYSPGTLTAGTVYYWRVVAKNAGGSNTSATWSFTTQVAAPPAPVPSGPMNGATGVSATPVLTWGASSGATSYDVYFGTTASPPLATNTAGTAYSPGTLSASTVYYWYVVAKNAGGSNASAIWSFTTQVAAPPAPVLSSPANGATGVSAAPVLGWSAASGATSYDVYFGTVASPPLATNTGGTTYSPGTLTAGTVYYWRVVGKNAGGSNTSATWSFTTQVAAPPAPVPSSPANGATGVSATPVLGWSASSGAGSYDVYFGTVSAPPLATNTGGTTYSPGTLTTGTVYYWRVVAKNAGGSNTSATWSFTTQVAAPPAPVPSGPMNGATGVSATPVLTWGASSGATSYDVYFGTAASPPLATNTGGATYSPGPLSAGTVYYWYVVAKNAGGSNASAMWSFTTQVAAPPAPALSGPANGSIGVSATPLLGWMASSGATSYDVYFGAVASPPLAASTAGTTYSPGTLSAGTTYYWHVVARNAGGSNASATWSFTTQVPPPAAPVLTAPANGAADVAPSLTLSWNASSGAASYAVYFGTSSPPPLVTSTTGTSYTPGALAGGTVYYWQVVATNPGGSNASPDWSFTTQVAAPSLVSPVNGAIGVSATPTLTWSASTGATSYDVYFGTQAAPPLVTNTTGTSYTPGTLSPGALYFWRVVARGSGGASASTTWSFTTPGPTAPVAALRFVPVPPCRIADTRSPAGPFGGPSMGANELRAIAIPQSGCGIPATAQAYSLNVTVVPQGRLSYLTLWPSGEAQPLVSTLNSFGGTVVANAAIVPAGAGGGVNIFVTDPTDVILDIDGYFDSTSGPNAYAFYPATPCRIADTRNPAGAFGGPSMAADERRDFALPSSGCGLPAAAKAYSLNVTVVPDPSVQYLGYLTTWPAGQGQPLVSTLNSWTGKVVANAALVPAGAEGAISVYVSDPTEVILDTNGYFAAPGSAGALSFYPVAPCRVVDTRGTNGPFGGPILAAQTARSFAIPSGGCGIPAGAAAYSMNVTVVPDGMLSYLTAWPAGAGQPFVSTLNSFDGSVVANAAIVPAGAGGAVSVFVTDQTHVVLDINGYFAP